jgi:hypothetical protein
MDFSEHHEWSNKACLGYAILAADRIGLTEDQEQKLLGTLIHVMDMNSVDVAEQTYINH